MKFNMAKTTMERKLTELTQNIAILNHLEEVADDLGEARTNNKPLHVFIPAWNEEENIERVINSLKQLRLNLKIYVIDDGSADKTAEKARKAGAIVVQHPMHLGGGAAVRTAFKLAMLNDVEYIITLDGDGQHDPKELLKIIEGTKSGADLVIGSRFLKKQRQRMPTYRLIGIKVFSWLISKIAKTKITDATSCYRAYKTEIIRKVVPSLNENQYYGLETILKITQNKAKIKEVPITNRPRNKGKSKKGLLKYGFHLIRTLIINSVPIKRR